MTDRAGGLVEVADGVRLLCLDDGPRDAARTYLLVHGWGCTGASWSRHIGPLSRDSRVLTVDLRGHGGSDEGAAGSATAQQMAADLALLLAASDARGVIAVGHSMGGTVASLLDIEHPGLLAGVVVIDPAYGADAVEMATARARSADYRLHGGRTPAASIAAAFSRDAPEHLLQTARHDLLATSADVLATSFESIYLGPGAIGDARSTGPWLASRSAPALGLYPSASRAFVEDPRAETTIAPVASHFLHLEEPDWFVATVGSWAGPL